MISTIRVVLKLTAVHAITAIEDRLIGYGAGGLEVMNIPIKDIDYIEIDPPPEEE